MSFKLPESSFKFQASSFKLQGSGFTIQASTWHTTSAPPPNIAPKQTPEILLNCCVGVDVLVGFCVGCNMFGWMGWHECFQMGCTGWNYWDGSGSMLQLTACHLKLIPIDPSPCNPTAPCPQLCSNITHHTSTTTHHSPIKKPLKVQLMIIMSSLAQLRKRKTVL